MDKIWLKISKCSWILNYDNSFHAVGLHFHLIEVISVSRVILFLCRICRNDECLVWSGFGSDSER